MEKDITLPESFKSFNPCSLSSGAFGSMKIAYLGCSIRKDHSTHIQEVKKRRKKKVMRLDWPLSNQDSSDQRSVIHISKFPLLHNSTVLSYMHLTCGSLRDLPDANMAFCLKSSKSHVYLRTKCISPSPRDLSVLMTPVFLKIPSPKSPLNSKILSCALLYK